jgi:murein DD-endopeptidase MepM/ murein hydrolase activator NlpD
MLPGKTRSIHPILNRFAGIAVASALAAGLGVSAAVPAGAATEEARKYTEAAKQASRALEKAKTKAEKSAKAVDEATETTATATGDLEAAEDALEAARAKLEEARTISAEHSQRVSAARTETMSLQRDDGLVDVAAEVVTVATGRSDNVVVKVVTGAVKAGLTGVVGPAVGLLDPLRDAVHGHIDDAERAFDRAEQREQAVALERMEAINLHRAAAIEASAAQDELRFATSSLKKAKKAEEEATEQQKKDAKSAKSAKSKAEEAKAAEKEAKKKAEAAAQRATGRSAAASATSRSATVSGKAMPGTGGINSRYGMRTHPITGVHKLHTGTDFGYGDGIAYAAAGGTVAEVTYDSAYGNMVTLSHGGGVQTRYAHLARASVSVGQQVGAGDLIGKIGSTGLSTGPHLHFEVLVGGDFVNPESWLG